LIFLSFHIQIYSCKSNEKGCVIGLKRHISHLRQECHNSKFGIFFFLVIGIERNVYRNPFNRLYCQDAVCKTRRWRAVVSSMHS
jgi:hypothetical protein